MDSSIQVRVSSATAFLAQVSSTSPLRPMGATWPMVRARLGHEVRDQGGHTLARYFASMSKELEDLDDEQRAAAEAVTGPVCIIAGAGTGKTLTVTHRLAHGIATRQVDPHRALAVTHSRKAAAELGERLGRLGANAVDARTVHSAGLRVAREFWRLTGRPGSTPIVLSDKEEWRLWWDTLRAFGGHEPEVAEVRDVLDEVGWARSRLVAPEDYPSASLLAGRHSGVDAEKVILCWNTFDEKKAGKGKADFADLLEVAADLIEKEAVVADAVRHRWAHVTVDEYQDTDPAQQRLLDAILAGGRDICVVGDPRQAIYGWKGAEPSYLTGFTVRYPDSKVFDLTRNYRSTPQILGWANRVATAGRVKALVATRPRGSQPRVTQLDDDQVEAAWVAKEVRRALRAGTPTSEIAVLYRFNATQARFEAAFAQAGIATVIADDSTFFEREEVRAVLVPFGQAARAQRDSNGLELLKGVLARSGFNREHAPEGLGAARARWESLEALLELVEAQRAGASADAVTLLAEINGLARRTHGPKVGGVSLSTLHKAKGLEWDVVFLVGMSEGTMPSVYAETDAELAEEERLLHVGVTRARAELHLTWATLNGRGWTNRPSAYLSLLSGAAAPKRQDNEKGLRVLATSVSGPECAQCAQPLKGIAARRLGVCAHCLTFAPGAIGERARALARVIDEAALEAGLDSNESVSPTAILRLLDQRPVSAEAVAATTGVGLRGHWADAAAEILRV